MSTITAAAVSFEVKAADVTARTFDGLAAAWSQDLGNDVIHKGAFARTLDHWKQAAGRRVIPLLDAHPYLAKTAPSFRTIVGKMTDAEERDDGLWTRYTVARTQAGDDLLALAKDGMLTGLSIGYEPVAAQTEQKAGVRHLKEVKLAEVSVVVFPMNPDARIDPTSVKAADTIRAMIRDGQFTDEQKAELRALLDATPAGRQESPAPEPKGLAPDDPKRLDLEARIRAIDIRRLATAH